MKNAENICLNCGNQLLNELYCPNCGQKTSVHNLSLKYLLASFLVAFLAFDKKLLQSLKDIWIPNKIALSFLAGKRSNYVNHLKFFLICLAVLFGLIALNINKLETNEGELARSSTAEKFYNGITDYVDTNPLDCDTLYIKDLKEAVFAEYKNETDSVYVISDNLINLNISNTNRQLNIHDVYNLSQDSLMKKYKLESDFQKFLARQTIKSVKGGRSTINFAIGNMFWGIILMTILMAGFLRLFYLRHHSYYAEHLMQIISYHCIVCLLVSLVLLIDLFIEVPMIAYYVAIVVSALHLMFSLKVYYMQGWIKTIIKAFLILNAYVISLAIIFLLIFFLSFLIF